MSSFRETAAERTQLARERSGLALAGVGALLLKELTPLALTAGLLVIACAVLVYLHGATRLLAPISLFAALAAALVLL